MQASAGGAARRQACASQVARPEVLGPLSALTALSGAALAGELGGLALDSDGYIWVPLDAGARLGAEGAAGAAAPTRPCSPPPSLVIRVDPASGKIDRCIDVGARRPTACAFGGGALDELYVTTRSSAYMGEAASNAGGHAPQPTAAPGSDLLHAQDLLRAPAAERGDGALLRLRIEGVRGQHSAFAFERAIPPPFVDIPDWTQAD